MRILVLQHVAVEHPGILRTFLDEDGCTRDTVQFDEGGAVPDLEPYDLMLVMGGPQDVWQVDQHPWLADEMRAIRRFVVDMGRPYLGICLGHQLLAAALGGRVTPAARPEVGVMSVHRTAAGEADPLFAGLPSRMTVLQWHSSEVAGLPPQAIALASSPDCAVQAFRFGDLAYGLQYHVEATRETVPEWAAIPEYARSLEAAMGEGAAARLDAEVRGLLPEFGRNARTIYENLKSVIAAGGGRTTPA